MNENALHLVELGLAPVLLGRAGEGLKRPLHKGWQTAVTSAAAVAAWPPRHNVGIRCGRQPHGRCLLVFDFDADAERIFPAWAAAAADIVAQPLVVVSSGRGYHAYVYVPFAPDSRTLAARRILENGRFRIQKLIETIGAGKQVVAAGGRHPSGRRYRFLDDAGYEAIPVVNLRQLSRLLAQARRYDERPAPPRRKRPLPLPDIVAGDCLAYARRCIGGEERIEANGDVRLLGHGGLLITANGRGWYAFSDDVGGGLRELIAWHQAQAGRTTCSN